MLEIIKSEAFIDVVNLTLKLLIFLFFYFLLPNLKRIAAKKEEEIVAKVGKENYATITFLINQAVQFFEREYKDSIEKMGAQKKAEVIDYLKSKGFTNIDDKTIDMIIDNAVEQMNRQKEYEAKLKEQEALIIEQIPQG